MIAFRLDLCVILINFIIQGFCANGNSTSNELKSISVTANSTVKPNVNNTSRTEEDSTKEKSRKELVDPTSPANATNNENDQNTSITSNTTTNLIPIIHQMNSGAVLRGFYVFVGLGTIVVFYIVIKIFRLRRKKTTVHKYGILTNREDVEMTPLSVEDDEDDNTLFDASHHTRS